MGRVPSSERRLRAARDGDIVCGEARADTLAEGEAEGDVTLSGSRDVVRDGNRRSRPVRHRRVVPHCDRGAGIVDGRRPADPVDHVRDPPLCLRRIEKDRQHVVQAAGGQRPGHLERVRGEDVHALVEEAIAAQRGSFERRDRVGDFQCRPAVDAWGLHPGRLARRVVRKLVLEKDDLATVSIPDHVVLLVMLDKQPGGRDIVAVDDDAVLRGVDIPPDGSRDPVVCSPGPDVIEDDVVTVDLETDVSLADVRTADPEEHVLQGGGVGSAARLGPVPLVFLAAADLQQHRRVLGAGVDRDASDTDARDILDRHHDRTLDRGQGGNANAQHDRVRVLHPDRLIDRVYPRREQQILAALQLLIDGLHRIARLGHEESRQQDAATRCRTVYPRRSRRVGAWRRYEHVVPASGVEVEIGLLFADRRLVDRRVGPAHVRDGGEALGRGPVHTGEHLVPDTVRPAADAAVACEVLLLGTVDHRAHRRVGDEATAGELWAVCAVIHQRQVAAGDVDPAHRRGL